MIRSIKQIRGYKLGALDCTIGHVKDFYFDDLNWAVRYLVADTGTWIPCRQVLISPHALGKLDQGGKVLHVNLTRQQIENSPSIDSHKPLSRQYEEEYHRYYGWPFYWQGDALWGMSGFPILAEHPEPFRGEQAAKAAAGSKSSDAHLRSAQLIIGYEAQSEGEPLGRVTDFLLDDENWKIHHVVLETGSWLKGRQVLVSPDEIERISWNESKVIVKLNRKAIGERHDHTDPLAGREDHELTYFPGESERRKS
jgi:hypothetical protein